MFSAGGGMSSIVLHFFWLIYLIFFLPFLFLFFIFSFSNKMAPNLLCTIPFITCNVLLISCIFEMYNYKHRIEFGTPGYGLPADWMNSIHVYICYSYFPSNGSSYSWQPRSHAIFFAYIITLFTPPPPPTPYKRLGSQIEGLPGLLSVGKDSHPLRSGSLSIHNTNLPFDIFPRMSVCHTTLWTFTLWQKSDLLIFVDLYYI